MGRPPERCDRARRRAGGAALRAAALAAALAAAVCSARGVYGASLAAVQSASALWEQTALNAAEATLVAIQKQAGGGRRLSLRHVPLESLRVFAGRQHKLAVELDGVEYKLSFQTDADGAGFDGKGGGGGAVGLPPGGAAGARALPGGAHSGAVAPLGGGGGSGASGALDPYKWAAQQLALPEITIAGPLELVFPGPTQVDLFTPHAAQAPDARRLLLAPGAALTLRGIRGVSLRRPLELPRLPPSYLAEVLAHARLGEPEAGFEGAPGMLYLARELYRQATNASLRADASKGRQLLSFEVEPTAAGTPGGPGTPAVTALSAALAPGAEPMRLKVRRLADGSGFEVLPRDAAAAAAAAGAAAAPGSAAGAVSGGSGTAVAHAGSSSGGGGGTPLFMWPMPLAGARAWLPYESLLRGVIATHPFNVRGVLQKGAELRLTQSSIHGVRLMSFDMELSAGDAPEGDAAARLGDLALRVLRGVDAERVAEGSRDSLEVWQAVVQVRERPGGGPPEYTPVSVKRKHDFHATLSLTPAGLADALGRGNGSEKFTVTLVPVSSNEGAAPVEEAFEAEE